MILTKEEKIRYIKEYNEGKPIKTPAGFRSRSAFKNSLLNWVKRYNLEGEKGLDRKPGRTPTPEERAAVVRRVKGGERTVDVAKDTGFSSGAISNWIRASSLPTENQVNSSLTEEEAMPEKEKTEKAPQTLEERNRFLEKENDRLRAEVASLKKSIALKVTKAGQQRKRK